jgi:hypothetical protein
VGSRLNKVLIDGGSGLNVFFTKTLKKMKLDITHTLTKSTSPFYAIVPGNAAIPLGSVVLPATFGETRENYRTEYIKFEVADFETSYHAILGIPAITKFMAVPHYTYLVLKMPSPAGVLSLQGDLKISFDYDTEAVELTTTNQVPNAMMDIYAASKKLAPSELDIPEKSGNANKPQPDEEVQVKMIDLGTGEQQDHHHRGGPRPEIGRRALLTVKDVSLYDLQAYRPHTFFTTGFPRFMSIRGARGLQAFNLLLCASY